MTWFTVVVVFIINWWLIFFIALPFGVRRAEVVRTGEDPGAPERPLLMRKALITTLVALLMTAAIYVIIDSELLSVRQSVTPWVGSGDDG